MSLNFFRKIFNLDLSKKASRKGRSRRLELLGLEERVVPATFSVINNSDSGAGSLRDAITLANTTAGNDIIDFNFTGTSPYTITLATALPNIVDASSTVGAGTAGTVTIDGLGASNPTISGSLGGFRIFTIDTGGNLSISGVTVSGANTSSYGGASLTLVSSPLTIPLSLAIIQPAAAAASITAAPSPLTILPSLAILQALVAAVSATTAPPQSPIPHSLIILLASAAPS